MFNEKLLIEILGWQSESHKEKEQIIPTLNQYLKSNFKNLDITTDTHGNIFVTKGKADLYPCIVSHLDQVHKYADNKKIIKNGDYLVAFNGPKQVGTGGDDLVGVFMCLSFLKEIDNIKVAFFVAEEVGCVGSNACDLSFFNDCMFIGQADRRENSDFINYSNGVELFGEEFTTFVKPYLEEHNYKLASGTSTDAGCLSKRKVGIACFNISCGYYGAHTSSEYVCISDVNQCYNLIGKLIRNAKQQFKFERVEKEYTYTNTKKSPMYEMLYDRFVKSKHYIKSNKMSYAYSKAIEFVADLIDETDEYIDFQAPDFPYISDILQEYVVFIEEKELEEEKKVKTQTVGKGQMALFDPNCEHRSTRYDLTMNQHYCMDCFSYIDKEEPRSVSYIDSYNRYLDDHTGGYY